jgi:peptide/nickel transport system substrate-binding protein
MGQGLALGLAPLATSRFRRDVIAAPNRQLGLKGGDGTLIVAVASEPVSFNPNLGAELDDGARLAAANIFSHLVTLDAAYDILPDLAQRWSITDDGLTYTFDLDRDATWHNGEPVTAADIKYTLDQIRANETAPAYDRLAAIAAIETPNERTLILSLSRPSASLLRALGSEGTAILPAHLYEGTDWATNPANQEPIGSGPFRFLSSTPGATVDLGAHHEYFGRGPFLDQLLFQYIRDPDAAVEALVNGEIDLITTPLPAAHLDGLRQTAGIVVGEQPLPSITFLGFNLAEGPTAEQPVRAALARAIDRSALVTMALDEAGQPATTFVPAVIEWTAADDGDSVPAFDPAAAAAELDEAGFPVTDGVRFSLVLLHDAAEAEQQRLGTLIQEQLRAVEVEIELVSLEGTAFVDRLDAGEFGLSFGRGPAWPDPSGLRPLVGADGTDNHWGYAQPELDALFTEAETIAEEEARATVYREVEALLAGDLPILPLVSRSAIFPNATRASGFFFAEDRVEVGWGCFARVRLDLDVG